MVGTSICLLIQPDQLLIIHAIKIFLVTYSKVSTIRFVFESDADAEKDTTAGRISRSRFYTFVVCCSCKLDPSAVSAYTCMHASKQSLSRRFKSRQRRIKFIFDDGARYCELLLRDIRRTVLPSPLAGGANLRASPSVRPSTPD